MRTIALFLLIAPVMCHAQVSPSARRATARYLGAASGAPTQALIVHYQFTEGSGTSVADSSGNGYNGTLTGATWVTGSSGSGNAVQFSGSSQYMQSPTITFGTNIVTVCGWIWWNAFGSGSSVVWELSPTMNSNDNTFFFTPDNAGSVASVAMQSGSGGGPLYRIETFGRWSAAAWAHIAVVYNNSTIAGDETVYVNGLAVATTVTTNTKDQTGNFKTDVVNLFSRGGSSLFGAGRLDDFRIYAGELTSGEVAYVYANPQ